MLNLSQPSAITTKQLLAMPEDGVERWLVRGQLREKPKRLRGRHETATTSIAGYFLAEWNRSQSPRFGHVGGGNAGFRLEIDPDTTMGIDVALVSEEVASIQDFPGLRLPVGELLP